MRKALSYDDVLLVPAYNEVVSRSLVSLDVEVAGLDLDLPIIASNMPSVCEERMAEEIAYLGGLGVIHRMQPIADQVNQVRKVVRSGAAIGIGEDWKDRAEALIEAGANIICIDVAHGHQSRVLDTALSFLDEFASPLIVGNIATAEAARDFVKQIADMDHIRVALKVGVGGGSVCTTRIKTGFGLPTFQSILEVQSVLDTEDSEMSIIADGGCRNSGDIVKALAAGADAIMTGSLLAGTDESPGEIIKDDKTGLKYKVYRGAASYGAKKKYFGDTEYIEGAERLVPYKGPLRKTILALSEGIKSGLTYCGVDNISDLREEAEFVEVTQSGYRESLPHGLF